MAMNKEEIMLLAHLLTALKDAVRRLEDAQKRKDTESILTAKREILSLHAQIKTML